MTYEEAAAIMMSGGGSGSDSRYDRLMNAKTIYGGIICGQWHYEVKCETDIDDIEYLAYYEGYVNTYRKFPCFYCCIYKDDFRFAIPFGSTPFSHETHYFSYGNDRTKVYSYTDNSRFAINNGTVTGGKQDLFLRIGITYSSRYIEYNDSGGVIWDETTIKNGGGQTNDILGGVYPGASSPIVSKEVGYYDSLKNLYKDWNEYQTAKEESQ